MAERASKGIVIAAVVLGAPAMALVAYLRPGYFISQTTLGGLLLLELLAVAVWMYRRVFFPIILVAFLFAGTELPVGAFWTQLRWVFLFVGALVGSIIMLRDRGYRIGWFHVLALFAVLAALVSAAVSRYSSLSFLKVFSLLLLFVYAGTGARLAAAGRENRFFAGLLTGCEIFVGAVGAAYAVGIDVMGNPNSLGAVMAVAGAPILLWGILVSDEPFVRRRRTVLFAVALYLTFASRARASMAAAFIACGLLCLALRKYRMLINGVVVIAIIVAAAAIFQPEEFSKTVDALTSSVVFKGKDPNAGLLASRESPWQDSLDSIHKHFWFGAGFGTSDNGQDATENVGKFSTVVAASSEHGSSYLAILSWVGVVGVLPFVLLMLVLLQKIVETLLWMRRTGNPYHPAIPLAIVLLAGMLHASLEDWLFAPGYYLCVFYWSIAFIFIDVAPYLRVPGLALRWRPNVAKISRRLMHTA
ncbi:MAG TPA: O-antigen ligase family protein [Candidatus Sulfotelmatobacter sp.]|nr:O-antigen ligase family protein [Candidatus Sulfotelmatobacter sp.]